MSQPTHEELPSGGDPQPSTPMVRVRTDAYEFWYQAHPGSPAAGAAPPLSFMPGWRPRRLPGRITPAEQIQRMIDQREAELAELRALQVQYPLPAAPPPAEPT